MSLAIPAYNNSLETQISAKEIKQAIRYNLIQQYTTDKIQSIQAVVGTTADGIFGPDTVQKISIWQEQNGLMPDGMIGPITFTEMFGHGPASGVEDNRSATSASSSTSSTSTDTETPGTVTSHAQSEEESTRQNESLRIITREESWLVFNRHAFRQEVINYLWEQDINPTQEELHSRSSLTPSEDGLQLDVGDTHWALAQTAFAARGDLYQTLRPEIRQQIQHLEDQSLEQPLSPPDWIPPEIWNASLEAEEGIPQIYSSSSPQGANIVLIRRSGIIEGYAEAPTDSSVLYQQMEVSPPSLVQRLLGIESPNQAKIRWLAEANEGYNRFMLSQVTSGIGVREARENYRDAVYQAYLRAFIPLIAHRSYW